MSHRFQSERPNVIMLPLHIKRLMQIQARSRSGFAYPVGATNKLFIQKLPAAKAGPVLIAKPAYFTPFNNRGSTA
ncbi:MAG: hypothetical protein KDA78_19190 [Planctomycetaceae bacterium]|nr:hypothetical protein [Planctomycetaceae bacterium]